MNSISLFVFPNGNIYKGEIEGEIGVDAQPHGEGALFDFKECTYKVGVFTHGVFSSVKSSAPLIKQPDGTFYRGDVDEEGRMTGRGRLINPETQFQLKADFVEGSFSNAAVTCKDLLSGLECYWSLCDGYRVGRVYLLSAPKNKKFIGAKLYRPIPAEWSPRTKEQVKEASS